MKDKKTIPFDFWNHNINPITGFKRNDRKQLYVDRVRKEKLKESKNEI